MPFRAVHGGWINGHSLPPSTPPTWPPGIATSSPSTTSSLRDARLVAPARLDAEFVEQNWQEIPEEHMVQLKGVKRSWLLPLACRKQSVHKFWAYRDMGRAQIVVLRFYWTERLSPIIFLIISLACIHWRSFESS